MQLLNEKTTKMLSEQVPEFFQIWILMAAFAELYFVILFPFAKEILQCVPLLTHLFPLFFWLQQGIGSRAVSVNKQLLKPRNPVRLTQNPVDVVVYCGPR